MVSAWASENRLVLGQLKTEAKSNEITAIPELLQVLDISGCIITIDAMGCQKKYRGCDYSKASRLCARFESEYENLFKEVTAFFAQAESENFRDLAIKYWETTTKDHGRLEIRRYWVTDQLATFEHTKPWKDIRLIGMVEAERTVRGKTTIERRYYISSLQKNVIFSPRRLAYIRGIENSVHWDWIWPFAKMNPVSERDTLQKTWPSSDRLHSIYCARTPLNEGSKTNGLKPVKVSTILPTSCGAKPGEF